MAQIISVVLIVAVTLVSSVVVGGFVFGTIGSSANEAQVGAIRTAVPASVGEGFTYVYCSVAPGNSVSDGYIELYNSGTKATIADSLSFVYDGATVQTTLTGPCNVLPDTSVYLIIIAFPYFTPSGTPYSGFVSTDNGAEVLFNGAFD